MTIVDTQKYIQIFNACIADYHQLDDYNAPIKNPFSQPALDYILYEKNWIDTVQWHFEDVIRMPTIKPEEALILKRRIDEYNQKRTDLVEQLDDYFYAHFQSVELVEKPRLNTESVAWAIDRLSILCLKIVHMDIETHRTDADPHHIQKCAHKLAILKQQQSDLCMAIETLAQDIQKGEVKILRYKQMKMYNDPSLNPILYNLKK